MGSALGPAELAYDEVAAGEIIAAKPLQIPLNV